MSQNYMETRAFVMRKWTKSSKSLCCQLNNYFFFFIFYTDFRLHDLYMSKCQYWKWSHRSFKPIPLIHWLQRFWSMLTMVAYLKIPLNMFGMFIWHSNEFQLNNFDIIYYDQQMKLINNNTAWSEQKHWILKENEEKKLMITKF
jgi:hypothetical protein